MTVMKRIDSAIRCCRAILAIAAAALVASPALAQNPPGLLQSYNNNRPFHPFAVQQFKAGTALNSAFYSNGVSTGNAGLFGSASTAMILTGTDFFDGVVSNPDPLFGPAGGGGLDDVLHRWLLQSATGAGLVPGTQVAGYLLGDYWDPVNYEPPYSGNVFRDFNSTGWDAPNQYINAVSGSGGYIVDDSDTNIYAPPFAVLPTVQAGTSYNPAYGDYTSSGFATQSPVAGAIDLEDQYADTVPIATGATATANWTIEAGTAGKYELYVNVPAPQAGQSAVTDATYYYAVNGPAVIGSANKFVVNQAGVTGFYDTGVGFTLRATDYINVTLGNTSAQYNGTGTPRYLLDNRNLFTIEPTNWIAIAPSSPTDYVDNGTLTTAYKAPAGANPFYWNPTSAKDGSLYTVEVWNPTGGKTSVPYGVAASGIGYTGYDDLGLVLNTAQGVAENPPLPGSGPLVDQTTSPGQWTQLSMLGTDGTHLAVPFKYRGTVVRPLDNNNYIDIASTGAALIPKDAVADAVRITKVDSSTVFADQIANVQYPAANPPGVPVTQGWTFAASTGGLAAYATAPPTTSTTSANPVSALAFSWAPNFGVTPPTPLPQMFNVLVYIPSEAAGNLAASPTVLPGIPDARFSVVAEGVTYNAALVNEQTYAGQWVALTDTSGNLLKVPYAANGDFVNNYVVLTNNSAASYPYNYPSLSPTAVDTLVYAGAVQFVASPAECVVTADAIDLKGNGLIVDNADTPGPTSFTDPIFSTTGTWNLQSPLSPSNPGGTGAPDCYGIDYLRTADNGATATWIPTIPSAGYYTVYAWFPTDTASEKHVTNAPYKINIFNNVTPITANVDQTNGGYWAYVAGPLYFPASTTGQSTIQVGPMGGMPANTWLIADAIELVAQGSNGATYSSAVTADITDYPELFYGYNFDSIATLGVDPSTGLEFVTGSPPIMPGGGYVNYIAGEVTGDVANGVATVSNGAVPTVHNNNLDPTIAYQKANPEVYNPISLATPAITQLVYFTRNENVGNSVAGAVYCVDGLTGDIVWKYPDQYTAPDECPGIIASSPIVMRNVLTRVNQPWYENGEATAKNPYSTTIGLSGGGSIVLPDGQCNFNSSTYYGTWNVSGYVSPPGWTSASGGNYPLIDITGDVYQPRTVVIVQDDNGKMFCIDAAGNGDGNDTIIDTVTGAPVSFTSAGPSNSTDTLQIEKVGTSRCYWCWQPDSSSPINPAGSGGIVADDSNAGTGDGVYWKPVTATVGHLQNYHYAMGSTSAPYSPFTWTPASLTNDSYYVYVSFPNPFPAPVGTGAATNAQFTVTDAGGAGHVCTVDETQEGGGWYPLSDAGGNNVFILGGASKVSLSNLLPSGSGVLLADAVLFVSTSIGEGVNVDNNLIVPSAYQLCSCTARTNVDSIWPAGATPATVYDSTLFVGNSNGVLYSINGGGTLADATGIGESQPGAKPSPVNPKIYDLSLDQTFPTVTVNWWFNSGSAIQYAPVYDATDDLVITSTYNSAGNNMGRVYAVNADVGPVGNGGLATTTGTMVNLSPGQPGGPDGYQYNDNPIPYWSFPDGYGTVLDTFNQDLSGDSAIDPYTNLPVSVHVTTSKQTVSGSKAGILPLGDVTGAPVLYANPPSTSPSYTSSDVGTPLIYITCNDPLTNSNGRVMCLTTGGNFVWSYPATLPPGSVDGQTITSNDPNFANTVDIQNAMFTPIANSNQTFNVIGPFSTQLDTPNYFVSSSPAVSLITPPSSDPQAFASHTTPVVFAGDLDGFLYALEGYCNLPVGNMPDVTSDANRLLYNEPVFDGSPIYSTPAVLSGSAGNMVDGSGSSQPNQTTGGDRGGSVWVTGSNNGMTELEAAPYQFNGNTYVNTDANIGASNAASSSPGGLSSPSLAGFDIYPLTYHPGNPNNNTPGTILTDISEWTYVGSDGGMMFGFTPNVTIGAGDGAGSINPANYIPPENQKDLPTKTDLTRNLITAVSPDGSIAPTAAQDTSGTSADPNGIVSDIDATKFSWYRNFSPVKFGHPNSATPPGIEDPSNDPNPVAEWGMTVYVKVFGVDNLNATGTTVAGAPDPKPLYVKFSLSNISGGTTSSYIETHTITADMLHWFQIGDSGSTSTWWPPSWLGSTSGTNSSGTTTTQLGNWVAVFPYVLGNGSTAPATPTVKMKLTDVEYHYLLDGQEGIVRARIDTGTVVKNPAGQLVATTPIDQATFAVLNPLAIRGAGLSIDSNTGNTGTYLGLSSTTGGSPDLGPFMSYDNMTGSSSNPATDYGVYKNALGNGDNVPLNTVPPYGGTITGSNGSIFNPIISQSSQTNATAYYTMTVATTTAGLLGHGTTGDNGTLTVATVTPDDPAKSNQEVGTAIPVIPNSSVPYGQGFGQSLLNVADRSALGIQTQYINNLRMTSTKMGWNDDSGSNGPGAIINKLPWDVNPLAATMGQTNWSPDYPDISIYNVNATLQKRITYSSGSSTDGSTPGTTINMIYAPGTLANTSMTSATGTNTRYVNPQSILMTVNVPQFQPANLEEYSYSAAFNNNQLVDGINRLSASANGANVPHGYIGETKIYIDSGNTGAWSSSKAYRQVQFWTGIQADMTTTIDQPTTDVGAVPAGFGIENPLASVWATPTYSGTSSSWNPFNGSAPSYYSNWYRQITARNIGNVNLINVHFDQYLDYSSNHFVPYNTPVVPLNLSADENSSQSFIPSIDSMNNLSGVLTSNPATSTGGPAGLMPIVRSSLDYFDQTASWNPATNTWNDSTGTYPYYNTYYPNNSELSTPGSSTGTLIYPGPTWHKARVNDNARGSYLTVPDEPHDSTNPAATKTGALRSAPTLSVAVPMGTPSGTYYQYLRLFEGYDAAPQSGLASMAYTGPLYGGAAVPIQPKSTSSPYALSLNTNGPMQTYSQSPTELKVTVTEARITSGTSGNVHLQDGGGNSLSASLPMLDTDNPQGLGTGGSASTSVRSNDLEPWAFPAALQPPTSGGGTIVSSAIGLVWASGRFDWSDRDRAQKIAFPYDILGSSISDLCTVPTSTSLTSIGTMIDLPSQAYGLSGGGLLTGGGWWNSAVPVTPFGESTTSSSPRQAYDPCVLVSSDGSSNQLLYVVSNTVSAPGSQTATSYSIYEEPITGANFSGLNFSTASKLLTSSQPIYDPRAVFWSYTWSSGGSNVTKTYQIIIWTGRIRNATALMYEIYDPSAALGSQYSTPAVLVTPTGLSDIGRACLTPRYLCGTVAAFKSGNVQPYLDVSYQGRTSASESSEVYTSRFQLQASSTTPSVSNLSLNPVSISPNTGLVQEALSPGANSQTFITRDVGWMRDPTRIKLYAQCPITNAGVTTGTETRFFIGSATSTSTTSTPCKVDPSSGAWIFSNVSLAGFNDVANNIYWNHQATNNGVTTMNVIIDPFRGTVTFSIPPDANVIDAHYPMFVDAAPTAFRVTTATTSTTSYTDPCAFLDDAPKANAAFGAGVNGGAVQAARYWYIYRKTGPTSDGTSITSTLCLNTRRLTMPLRYPIALASNTPVALTTVSVSIADDDKGTNSTDVTGYVDIDWQRGRIYFPEQFDGLYTQVTYTGVAPSGGGYTSVPGVVDPPASGTVTYQPIQWMDEPYSNSPQDAATVTYTAQGGTSVQYPLPSATMLVGERAVPINNNVNESQPCAFLDTAAGLVTITGGSSAGVYVGQSTPLSVFQQVVLTSSGNTSGPIILNPHKVWLFWTSNRNSAHLVTYPVTTSLASAAPAGSNTFTVNDPTNIQNAMNSGQNIFRIDRGTGNTEDVVVNGISGSTVTINGSLQLAHAAGKAFGNVGLKDFVRVQSSNQATAYKYWTPIEDNPDATPSANNAEWALYTGSTSIYWEALDPRFQLSP